MAATVSLSKGVFAFKKSNAKNKNSRDSISSSDYWRQEEGKDDPHIADLTLKNYHQCWFSASRIIEKFLDENHAKVFEDLVDYVGSVGFSKCRSLLHESININKDIPAACLVTGVNMPDHATIFDSLTKSIKERVSPHVARLSTADCSSIKVALYKLIYSLMNEDEGTLPFESDTDDEIFIHTKSLKRKNVKKMQCNMATLSSWYKETEIMQRERSREKGYLIGKSPTKRQKTSPTEIKTTAKAKQKHSASGIDTEDENEVSPSKHLRRSKKGMKESNASHPIIIIIEEVESIPVQVLQDLILITSEYQRSLPFLFIFGVSTTPSYIHWHLSQEASLSVSMETFQAQPSTILLSEVIEKILMNSNLPFRVGGKVFKLLLDIFLFHDLSIKNFISRLKFCMLEHFLRGEGSFLCCGRKERESILQNLTPREVSALRNLSSYKRLQESLLANEREKMENDFYFCKRVSSYLDELESWYGTFCTLVKILHSLVHTLPGTPLGRQVRELLSLCLGQQVTETEEFQRAWKLFSLSAKEELASKIQEAIGILNECEKNAESEELREDLLKYYERLSNIENEPKMNEEKNKPSSLVIDLKPSDRFYLREKLLGKQKMKTSRNPFEELRTEILTCFERAFISHLKPVNTKAFHEACFFDSIANVKYQLLGSVRTTITTGLANPHKYLQCACCKVDDSSNLLTSLPDLSLCYKLHLECGRLINLYDWMQAFITVIGGDDDESSVSLKKKKTVNETIQARFIQSVSELQLLGFIKPTKRKTDHVQRLTWGGC